MASPGVRLRFHVQPGASSTGITGWHGDAIKIRLAAPPVDGRANDLLLEFLSTTLSIAQSQVQLVRGSTSRSKIVLIVGLDEVGVLHRLGVAKD